MTLFLYHHVKHNDCVKQGQIFFRSTERKLTTVVWQGSTDPRTFSLNVLKKKRTEKEKRRIKKKDSFQILFPKMQTAVCEYAGALGCQPG